MNLSSAALFHRLALPHLTKIFQPHQPQQASSASLHFMRGDFAICFPEQEQQTVPSDADELMQPDRQPEPNQTYSAVMLLEVLQVRSILLHVKTGRRTIRACAAIMDRLGL